MQSHENILFLNFVHTKFKTNLACPQYVQTRSGVSENTKFLPVSELLAKQIHQFYLSKLTGAYRLAGSSESDSEIFFLCVVEDFQKSALPTFLRFVRFRAAQKALISGKA